MSEPVAEAQPATEVVSEQSSPSIIVTSTVSVTPSTTPTATATTTPTATPKQQQQQQTVRRQVKKKDKNDLTRFQGEGVNFNAKLIGVDDVPDARGDRMCQETIYRLKLSVKASGQHKPRIIVNVSEEGIKLVDLRTAVVNYTHAVHKISFISRDVTDSRAFGYIFGVGDGTHKFFGLKTEKAAEALVLTLRDLFQVVYEKKKKEMEEAKQKAEEEAQAKAQEVTPPAAPNPNVIKLDGELCTESSTDDEPVYQVPMNGSPIDLEDSPEHIYAVPSNNSVVKDDTAGNNLVDLENELETIEQGIEQMNKFESEFDALSAGTTTGTSSVSPTGSDPWGSSSTPGADQKSANNSLFEDDFGNGKATNGAATSGQSDLQDIDLFGTQPVIKGKDDIMNLFGPKPRQMTPGFGPSVSPIPPAFGAPAPMAYQPGYSQPAFPPPQPFPGPPVGAMPHPTAPNPFGGPAAPFGAPQFPAVPPVPQRPAAIPPPINNPFGEDPFTPAAPVGGFAAFPEGNFGGGTLFDDSLLAPVKVSAEEPPSTEDKPAKGDAFGDLCGLGPRETTSVSPKGLFAELNAQPKKSINQLRTEKVTPEPQASDRDPFGSVDDTSLPAVVNFSSPFTTNSSDPFDTSHILTSNQTPPDTFHNVSYHSSTKSKLKMLAFSDNDEFDLPSPEGPPPPLPTLAHPSAMHPVIPPAPPPRPSGSPAAVHMMLPPPNTDSPPKLPPRNSVSNLNHTSVPRPWPRPKVNGMENSPTLPPRNKNMLSSPELTSQTAKNVVEDESRSKMCSDNVIDNKCIVDKFIIEDPFLSSDPFAETDVFSPFDAFSVRDDFNSTDPFMSSFSNHNGEKIFDSVDDPFAVFDNCLNESFSTKGGNSRKNSKKKRNSTGCDDTNAFGDFFDKQERSKEPVYAVVKKPSS